MVRKNTESKRGRPPLEQPLVPVSLKIPADLKKELEDMAHKYRRSVSNLAVQILITGMPIYKDKK